MTSVYPLQNVRITDYPTFILSKQIAHVRSSTSSYLSSSFSYSNWVICISSKSVRADYYNSTSFVLLICLVLRSKFLRKFSLFMSLIFYSFTYEHFYSCIWVWFSFESMNSCMTMTGTFRSSPFYSTDRLSLAILTSDSLEVDLPWFLLFVLSFLYGVAL